MRKSNIINYKNPSQNLVTDVLSEFLRESAQKMLQLAIEEEVQNFISSYQDKLLTNGSKQVVRNGYLPERNIQTGIGEVAVKVPRVRDRGKEDIKFSSNSAIHEAYGYYRCSITSTLFKGNIYYGFC